MTPRRIARMAAVALLLAVRANAAGEATVFRCVEPNGRVLYTDVACRNADVVELHPGKADPAAAQLLAYAQGVLDAGMERLRAQQAQEAERNAALAAAWAAQAPSQPPQPVDVADTYWPVYGFVPTVRPRPPHVVPIRDRPPNGRPQRPGKAPPPPRPMPTPR
jgi:hypothetical protein